MGKKQGVRKQFVAGIEQVNVYVSAGDKRAAQRILAHLRGLIREDDPNAAARFRAVLDVHDQRVADMDRNPEAPTATPRTGARTRPLPDNATCARCLSPFHRDNERVKVCDICRPPEQRSVRTVSAGLPGLGRRR